MDEKLGVQEEEDFIFMVYSSVMEILYLYLHLSLSTYIYFYNNENLVFKGILSIRIALC